MSAGSVQSNVASSRATRTPSMAARSSMMCTVDRKSTRLNSSHLVISYAVFCLKKKKWVIGLTPLDGLEDGACFIGRVRVDVEVCFHTAVDGAVLASCGGRGGSLSLTCYQPHY